MYLLYCDETNLEERENDFFAYGGISIPCANALSLSAEIDSIRSEYGVPTNFRLKFNPGPEHLSHNDFINLKQRIIEAAIHNGTKLFVSLILHNIATSPDNARINEINRVCLNFDYYLNRIQSHGLVLLDRFDDGNIDAHLVEKFSTGIIGLPFTPVRRLQNIVGFHYSVIGQSHFGSIIDIIMGSFRHCINEFTRDNVRTSSARTILPILAPLFYREARLETVSDISLTFSPRTISVIRYKEKYDALKGFLNENGVPLK